MASLKIISFLALVAAGASKPTFGDFNPFRGFDLFGIEDAAEQGFNIANKAAKVGLGIAGEAVNAAATGIKLGEGAMGTFSKPAIKIGDEFATKATGAVKEKAGLAGSIGSEFAGEATDAAKQKAGEAGAIGSKLTGAATDVAQEKVGLAGSFGSKSARIAAKEGHNIASKTIGAAKDGVHGGKKISQHGGDEAPGKVADKVKVKDKSSVNAAKVIEKDAKTPTNKKPGDENHAENDEDSKKNDDKENGHDGDSDQDKQDKDKKDDKGIAPSNKKQGEENHAENDEDSKKNDDNEKGHDGVSDQNKQDKDKKDDKDIAEDDDSKKNSKVNSGKNEHDKHENKKDDKAEDENNKKGHKGKSNNDSGNDQGKHDKDENGKKGVDKGIDSFKAGLGSMAGASDSKGKVASEHTGDDDC